MRAVRSSLSASRALVVSLAAALPLTLVGACALPSSEASTKNAGPVTLRYQGGANNVTLPELAADLGYFPTIKLKWVGNTTSGPQDRPTSAARSPVRSSSSSPQARRSRPS